jgi:hypothetical protein
MSKYAAEQYRLFSTLLFPSYNSRCLFYCGVPLPEDLTGLLSCNKGHMLVYNPKFCNVWVRHSKVTGGGKGGVDEGKQRTQLEVALAYFRKVD